MESRGSPIPYYINPAEFLLDLTSSDFADDSDEATANLTRLHTDWEKSENAEQLASSLPLSSSEKPVPDHQLEMKAHANFPVVVLALLHRSFIKSYRDVVAYGIRLAMYIGLAIMMGTVWLRLPETQSSIGPFTNAIVSQDPLPKWYTQANHATKSSSALLSCHSWPSPTSPPSSRTAPPSSRNAPMASTAPLLS